MQTNRILMVVTSSDRMGNAPEPTGYWLEEVAGPYYAFIDARCDVTLASPLGGKAPCDPKSLAEESQTAATRRFEVDEKAQKALGCTLKLSSIDPADFDAIYFPGGHGTMEDFPNDSAVTAVVEAFYRAGKPVASVCHGPAALVNARTTKGEPLVKGHRFTCFSNSEERTIGCETLVPFLLESRLTELGGTAQTAPDFQSQIVIDRQLMTGQNPASSIPLAEAVIYSLRQRMAA